MKAPQLIVVLAQYVAKVKRGSHFEKIIHELPSMLYLGATYSGELESQPDHFYLIPLTKVTMLNKRLLSSESYPSSLTEK